MSLPSWKPARPAAPSQAAGQTRSSKQDEAFDLWLHRGLQTIYGDVAKEPIPEELLALIQASAKTSPN